jgi:hypothetical protein
MQKKPKHEDAGDRLLFRREFSQIPDVQVPNAVPKLCQNSIYRSLVAHFNGMRAGM